MNSVKSVNPLVTDASSKISKNGSESSKPELNYVQRMMITYSRSTIKSLYHPKYRSPHGQYIITYFGGWCEHSQTLQTYTQLNISSNNRVSKIFSDVKASLDKSRIRQMKLNNLLESTIRTQYSAQGNLDLIECCRIIL